MSSYRLLMAALGVAGAAAPAMADFVRPVPSNDPPGLFGPNRIGANDVTGALEGQHVDACGRVGVVNAAMHAMQIGNRLIVFPPPGVDPTPYMGTVVCAGRHRPDQNHERLDPADDHDAERPGLRPDRRHRALQWTAAGVLRRRNDERRTLRPASPGLALLTPTRSSLVLSLS